MNKDEDVKLLKIQTWVLKVNIHCDGCKHKVKKLLQKIDGVYTTVIDAEKGTVTVSGDVDAETLLKRLAKAGKPAELISPKVTGGNFNQLVGQFQKLQLSNGKVAGKDGGGKPANGGGNAKHKGQPPPHNLMKGFKDLNFPLKDVKMPYGKNQKTVKFNVPDEGSDEDDDEFDDDDYDDDFDDLDCFDDDFEDDAKGGKTKGANAPPPFLMAGAKKPACGGKKGGAAANPPGKPATAGEKKMGGGGKPAGVGKGGGKNGGNGKPAAGGGGQKNNGHVPGGPPMMGHNGMMMGGMNMPRGGGHMGNNMMNMAPTAPSAAVQGLPANGGPPGFYPAITPEMFATANPYQQQYLAAMMQQQRMAISGQDRAYQPMMPYMPRPPPPVSYFPPPPPEYTHLFSDENTHSCHIM